MTFQRISSCSSGFLQDFLHHQVLINVWPMMSGAYNALLLPQFLFNGFQTFAQCSLCFGKISFEFSKSYVMFFGIY